MSHSLSDTEDARIRAAYARRTDATDKRYSWFNDAHMLAVQERERAVLAALRQHGFDALHEARIVEFGCGTGGWLREFVKWGATPANLTGVDLLADRLIEAERLCPPGVRLVCSTAASAPIDAHGYDIVLQSMMFSSILDSSVRSEVAAAMLRAVSPRGVILSFDYQIDNPRNPDVRGVPRRELARLFAGCRIATRRLTLAAPLARRVAGIRSLHAALNSLPWLRTHLLSVIHPPAR